jgi:2,4-diketo-3-deoxy-L-fuconate hydrolase
MKLLRHGPVGQERPGLLDEEGQIRDLSGHVEDITPACLHSERLTGLGRFDRQSLPIVNGHPRLGVPVAQIGKIVAIGLNYVDHAAEANLPIPKEPPVFLKATNSLSGPNHQVILPNESAKGDWEVELGIVIGRRASYVDEREGKGCDTFGPVGPWLVTADEVGDPQMLDMWLDVNGVRMQTGNTRTMIFSARHSSAMSAAT